MYSAQTLVFPEDEVERLRKILLERDTGIPTDPDTVLPKDRNI
jgi:predicted Zn-dependent peptidase